MLITVVLFVFPMYTFSASIRASVSPVLLLIATQISAALIPSGVVSLYAPFSHW